MLSFMTLHKSPRRRARLRQRDRFAFAGKRPARRPRPEHSRDAVRRLHQRRIRRDDEKPARRDRPPRRDRERHAARQRPSTDIHRRRRRVVQLDEFEPGIFRKARAGAIQDFIHDDLRVQPRDGQEA